jgi:hypothetical protein
MPEPGSYNFSPHPQTSPEPSLEPGGLDGNFGPSVAGGCAARGFAEDSRARRKLAKRLGLGLGGRKYNMVYYIYIMYILYIYIINIMYIYIFQYVTLLYTYITYQII